MIKYFLFFLLVFLNKKLSLSQSIVLPVNEVEAQMELPKFIHPALTVKFYQLYGGNLFWFKGDEQSIVLRKTLKDYIDSAVNIGLGKEFYHFAEITAWVEKKYLLDDSIIVMHKDRVFTDAAIALCKDIYQGKNINSWLGYDEVSPKYSDRDNDYLLSHLAAACTGSLLSQFIISLEPLTKEYVIFKKEFKIQQQKKEALIVKQLSATLNYFRWIHHFSFEKCIVVNIASATLRYYEQDTVKLKMKVVVGKLSTKTPRFAAYCNQVILYPYWNVPTSIALNELLPRFKRNPSAIDEMAMQVIDGNGRVLNHYKLNWAAYSKKYFPYRFRQSTGCDNSLGVIKFNITDPYSVYLHDTNNKTAFLSGHRYYSHGCIRLEEPVKLGNFLLNNRLDTAFLRICYKEQQPVPVDLSSPVPVMVIYSTIETDVIDKIKYYKDVYGLMK